MPTPRSQSSATAVAPVADNSTDLANGRLSEEKPIYSSELGSVHVMPSPKEIRQRRVAGVIAVVIAVIVLWRVAIIGREQGFLNDIRAGNQGGVKAYLASGGSATIHGFDGKSALELAVSRGDGPMTGLLLQSGAPITLDEMNTAAVRGYSSILYALLERHGSENLSSEQKGQLLCSAAQSGDMDSVKLLLHRGAFTTTKNSHDDNMTPLMYAARSGKTGVIYTLLDAGADIQARTAKGATVLMIASAWNAPETCQYLIKNGADVNAADNQGNTALMLAANVGNVATTDLLIGYGADVSARNKAGKSVIGWAIEGGNGRILNLLHRHGARP